MRLNLIISILISLGIIMSGTTISAQTFPFKDVENHEGKEHISLLYNRGIVKGREDGFFYPYEPITGAEFVVMILRDRFGEIPPINDDWWSGYIDFALREGIIEDFDNENAQKPVTRQSVSRILHQVLLKVYNEEDEEWSAAEKLLDLYSCHTCVIHVAQVYIKGIMPAKENVFNLNGGVTRGEAAMFIARIIDPALRCNVENAMHADKAITITYEEMKTVLSKDERALLIDVREPQERLNGYLEKSVSIPFSEILSDTAILPDDKTISMIVYCKSGMRSKKACEILVEKGYENVYNLSGGFDGAMK